MVDKTGCTIWRARVVGRDYTNERMCKTKRDAENWLNWKLTLDQSAQISVRECTVEWIDGNWVVSVL